MPILHAFHERDGFLKKEVLREISNALKIPIAELYTTITFYHHLDQKPPGHSAPRVCQGPVCCLRGSGDWLKILQSKSPKSMACAGRCDDPIPVLIGKDSFVAQADGTLSNRPSPLPIPNPSGFEECLFAKIRNPHRSKWSGYNSGKYQALEKVLKNFKPIDVIELIEASQLAGRGGAGFPTGMKWRAVSNASGNPKTIVCNADEGEPGCFKDRVILDYDPHAVIEGMILAAYATGATRGFIYLRYEYPRSFEILKNAIRESKSAGYLGESIGRKNFRFDIHLRRGAGAYICGEEGSLLNSLEGKHPFPRNRPPFPVTHGFCEKPTAVNNVETLAAIAPIISHGSDWYRSLGFGNHSGTKIISLSGDIQKPGNYEIPLGLPLSTLLYDWAGGALPNRKIMAVTMAGLSGGFLSGEDLEITLDDPSIKKKGSFLGAGGIIVYDDSRDMIAAAKEAMTFFAEESCGKCFPCRIGTQRLAERLAGEGPKDLAKWKAEVADIGNTMMATSACGLGMAAPNITKSLVKYFPERVAKFTKNLS